MARRAMRGAGRVGTPFDEQVPGITKFVADPGQVAVETMKLHDRWMAGDVDGLANDASARMRSETPASCRLLVVERNNAWLPQLATRADGHGAGTPRNDAASA
ncbi:MAG: hypothetical protein ACTHOH_02325 [Lysobacteraceae bacterium]